MSKNALFTLAVAVILTGAGCERHPAARTVPGFEEKQAQMNAIQEQEARTPLTINPKAPKFFPPADHQR